MHLRKIKKHTKRKRKIEKTCSLVNRKKCEKNLKRKNNYCISVLWTQAYKNSLTSYFGRSKVSWHEVWVPSCLPPANEYSEPLLAFISILLKIFVTETSGAEEALNQRTLREKQMVQQLNGAGSADRKVERRRN